MDDKNFEGRIEGIKDVGESVVLDILLRIDGKLNVNANTFRMNKKDGKLVYSKTGEEVKYGEDVTFTYKESHYTNKTTGEPAVSKWINHIGRQDIKAQPAASDIPPEPTTTTTGEEGRPETPVKPPTSQEEGAGFDPADKLPKGEDIVAVGARLWGRCYQAIDDNLDHKPTTDGEMAAVNSLFIYACREEGKRGPYVKK